MSKRIRVKPSKGQSAVGFAGGIIFCLIGLFVVIPTFGVFGVFWTLIAVVITIGNATNAFTDRGIATHEITIEDEGERNNALHNYYGSVSYDQSVSDHDQKLNKTVEVRLIELESLYQKGLIRTEEYEKKRQDILEEI